MKCLLIFALLIVASGICGCKPKALVENEQQAAPDAAQTAPVAEQAAPAAPPIAPDTAQAPSEPAGGDQGDKEKAALAAAQAWLDLVDSGKYDTSWNDAAQYFKSSISQSSWRQSLQAVRAPLGKNESRKLMAAKYATSLPGAPDGEYVVIQFGSSFESKKEAVETITPMREKDGSWRVSGYFIK